MAKRITALIVSFLMVFSVIFPCAAENESSAQVKATAGATEETDNSYDGYLSKNNGDIAKSSIKITSADLKEDSKSLVAEYKEKENTVFIEAGKIGAGFTFNVENPGFYNLGLSYCAVKGAKTDLNIGIMLDGSYTFDGMNDLSFPRLWEDTKNRVEDENGNQYTPEQVEVYHYAENLAIDKSGKHVDPYMFYLSNGAHTIDIASVQGSFYIDFIEMKAPEQTADYKDIKQNGDNYNGDEIVIEGESAYLKNSSSLGAGYDNGSAGVTPSSATKSVLNYIGGENWSTTGETIYWNINIPKSGFYKLGFNYRQNYVLNGNSYRWLKIDGETPSTEAKNTVFKYTANWAFTEFGGEDAYKIYLEEGEHVLSLSVTMGEWADISRVLNDYITEIGNLYIDITMITGESVDKNRDYDLFKMIPNFEERLQTTYDNLKKLSGDIEEMTGRKSGTFVSTINNMAQSIKGMIDNPYTAQNYVGTYYSNYCSLSSVLYDMTDLPLDIDKIVLAAPDKDFLKTQDSFIKNLGFSIKRFVSSFASKYNAQKTKDTKHMKLWINWGRDQARVLQSLIQDSFTPDTDIKVDMQIVNASIIQGIVSDNAPDCVLQATRSDPVNMAMRGALYDLKNFKDYDEVASRFMKGADDPYKYNGGVYAIPDTQNFTVLYYRTDIFEKLGLSVPKTWDEFIEVASVLQRNNLQASIPYTQITDMNLINMGVGALSLFPTLLVQNGIKLYNDDLTKTTLTSSDTISIFTYWTDFYTKHKFPVSIDFYNRFRVGTVPMGVSSYLTYPILKAAAPEIAGRWKVTTVPGVKQADETINYSETASGSGCSILECSDNKDEAWEFLKWWTSAETQLRYTNNVEAIMGVTARQPTSNVEALKQLAWDHDSLEQIMLQWNAVEELPEVPGGYYAARGIDQAYWNTINANRNPKEMMLKWGKIVDNEIERKEAEYVQ